jgi:hypothetical protein
MEKSRMKKAIHHIDPSDIHTIQTIQVDPSEHVREKTRVTFRKWKVDGTVIAFMIDLPAPLGYMAAYARPLGRFDANYWGLLPQTVPCKPGQYDDTDRDLRDMGFNIKITLRVRDRRGNQKGSRLP